MIEFKLGQTVQRQDPGGEVVHRDINTQADIDYHTDLQNKGYVYTALRKMYTGEGVCTSCEG